jgi:putative transcription factor
LRCEVCGRKIHGEPVKAIIEGARLTVCSECSRYGTIALDEPKQSTISQELGIKSAKATKTHKIGAVKKYPANLEDNLELVHDFSAKIRHAREEMGLTCEELGKRINEKVSVLKKVEAGKMVPDNKLVAKLEHALRIKLLAPKLEEKGRIDASNASKSPSRGLTLGDLIQLDKGETEEKA